MMKILSACSLFTIAFCLPQIAFAQSVERPRPSGWDRIVPGGRFNLHYSTHLGTAWSGGVWYDTATNSLKGY